MKLKVNNPPLAPLINGGTKEGILITGGAGFIGCNTAARLMQEGYKVFILDNLSRKGTEKNLEWLKSRGGFKFIRGDIRNEKLLNRIFRGEKFSAVLHLAAQVAVTTSVKNPVEDFEINARGTLNLLEAIRKSGQEPVVIYTSTNKVYGGLEGLRVKEKKLRYELLDYPGGISEDFPLDFHSPYGCSKGSADQYVRDYGRIYGMRTVVLRQSCIYGPHQFGIEDQGWVAFFIKQVLKGKTITIYGNGKQVRDLLFVDDLVELYLKIIKSNKNLRGVVYNTGGGVKNSLSLLELIEILKQKINKKIKLNFSEPRPGDQRVFIADIKRLKADFNWKIRVGYEKGIEKLIEWITHNL